MNSLWNVFMFLSYSIAANSARIENNGYKEVSISFSENVLQSSFDFEALKDVLRNASKLLFHATRRRSYFEEFVLVVPSTFAAEDVCKEYVTEAPKNVDIYITDPSEVPKLRTQHSKKCGKKGDIIYIPNDWLRENTKDLALQFVRQWSIFRYGVFPEDPERPGSCFASSDQTWSPTGCYNIELDEDAKFDENGLPVCYLPDNFDEREDLDSSIMFSRNSSKLLNFCDGSESFPHNPVAPTLHNRICGGKAVWSIIKNSEDFQYGRNLPLRSNPSNTTTFRCFQESKSQMTLVVQSSSSSDLTKAMAEIRYALQHFFSTMAPTDFNVSLITFSDIASEPVTLNLEDKKELNFVLDTNIKQDDKISNICLTCGLRKAYKVSEANQYPYQVTVLLAWESSLERDQIPDFIELVQSNPSTILYLLFVKDTISDAVPVLMQAVQAGGVRIFRMKQDPVLMITQLNIALLDAFENALQIEDKTLVVHEKVYMNITSDIIDTFLTPKVERGKLLYTMHCDSRGDIRNVDGTCSDWDTETLTYKCGKELDLGQQKAAVTVWKHQYVRNNKMNPFKCSSLAMLKLESRSTHFFTLRGWFNENEITPGRNALIIYAEVIGSKEQEVQIEAKISGPELENFFLELRDNGNGDPDTIKGDNIYSRYFTSFTNKGIYTVTIYATFDVANKNFAYAEGKQEFETKLTQTKIIGSFSVTEMPPQEDIFPPNRIADLNAVSVDNQNDTVLLQWTAPGDNYDYGKAKQYVIKLSKFWTTLLDFTFNGKENTLLKLPNGHLPTESGGLENFRLQCPQRNSNATYYIALRAIDGNDNEAEVSNIIQIHFKEQTPSLHNLTTIDESPDYNFTTALYSTETDNSTIEALSSTSFDGTSTVTENMTLIENETNDGIFIEKKIAIIAFSTSGAIILLLIIINIIVCCCCFRKQKSEKPKKPSRTASLRPPYNLNIAYRHSSQSSVDEENEIDHSLSTLADHDINHSTSQQRGMQTEDRYTYHTNKSLMGKNTNQKKKNDLGFNLVEPMPAYATSSLSRFASQNIESDDAFESSIPRSTTERPHQITSTRDTQVYSLGVV